MPPKRKLPRPSLDAPSLSDPASPMTGVIQSSPPPPSKLGTTTNAPAPATPSIDLNEPWTDEQEIALLKAIVRWKPVGMHKHFRMIAIKQFMDAQPCVNVEKDVHVGIPGIWEKLASWYNLEVLDEREDSILASPPQSPKPPNSSIKPKSLRSSSTFQPFTLPPDFHDLMFERRLAPEGTSSPPLSALGSIKSRSRRESTIPNSAEPEPRSSPLGSGRGGSRKAIGRSTRATATERAARKVEAEMEEEAEAEEEAESDGGDDKAAAASADREEEENEGEEEDEEESGSDENEGEDEDEEEEDDDDDDDDQDEEGAEAEAVSEEQEQEQEQEHPDEGATPRKPKRRKGAAAATTTTAAAAASAAGGRAKNTSTSSNSNSRGASAARTSTATRARSRGTRGGTRRGR